MIQKHINLFFEAAASVVRNRGRSAVVLFCLVGVLLPFVTAMALAYGVRAQSLLSVQAGADLYVSGDLYGRNGPVDLRKMESIKSLPGVLDVVPRIVGRAYLGEELVVVTATGERKGVTEAGSIRFRAPASGEALMGASLARRLGLKIGDSFHFGRFPALPLTITQLVAPEMALWSSSMVIINFMDAQQIFKRPGFATELLIYCRPGTEDIIAEQLSSAGKPWEMRPSLRIQTRKIVEQYVGKGFDIQAGMFAMLYLTAFGLSIPALLILTGFGRGERTREIGIMKATGWQTLDILEMVGMENLLLALSASGLSLALAMVWLKLANGAGIAPLFISGSGWLPDFRVPARFTPMPALLSFLFGLSLTMIGTIVPSWRAAVTPPRTTMH